MLLKEYLELKKVNSFQDLSLVVATAVKDTNTPYYHMQYYTTPIHTVEDWLESQKEYILLNHSQPPICSALAPHFANMYNNGRLLSMLVTTKEDIYKLYSKKQAEEELNAYDKAVRASINY